MTSGRDGLFEAIFSAAHLSGQAGNKHGVEERERSTARR